MKSIVSPVRIVAARRIEARERNALAGEARIGVAEVGRLQRAVSARGRGAVEVSVVPRGTDLTRGIETNSDTISTNSLSKSAGDDEHNTENTERRRQKGTAVHLRSQTLCAKSRRPVVRTPSRSCDPGAANKRTVSEQNTVLTSPMCRYVAAPRRQTLSRGCRRVRCQISP